LTLETLQERSFAFRINRRRVAFIGGSVLWLVVVSIGLGIMWTYEQAPGVAAEPPVQWPTSSHIQRTPGEAALIILAHPHCPCTRASIGELARIMAHCQGRLTAYVLFTKPAGSSDDWEKTDLWQNAAAIPGVKVILDSAGREATLFHASTSGQAVLYDATGHMLFKGGITASRGHSGDNDGASAIVSLVNAGVSVRSETFVYGCPLFNSNSECKGSHNESNNR
jgi:hypothetical protein